VTPIHALVFSKGRAMQLDALLRSMEAYAPVETVTVLLAEECEDDASYQTLIDEWLPRTTFAYDRTFEQVVRIWLDLHERVVFHTDDELYFAHPPVELLELDNSETILTLRQGRNTTYCHPLSCEQPVPKVFPWRWREAQLDFAYPLSLNATVYNTRDLLPLLDFHFNNPTQLEACWAANASRLQVEWMTAPERSCTVALPHNVTSVSSGNPRGDWPDYQPEALRAFYLEGWRIDPFALDYNLVDAAHVELPLVFERSG
jgi:hypothetical protein